MIQFKIFKDQISQDFATNIHMQIKSKFYMDFINLN